MLKNFRTLMLIGLLLLSSVNALAQPQTYIFVSFSMPDAALKEYYLEAQQTGAILVMQGLRDNSFMQTRDKAMELGINFNIDPNLFEEYQIKQIPVIIVDDGKGFVKKLTGHIPLSEVLKIMEKDDYKNLP
nr:TrbC family F-type conjugative pilus assembly protein [Rickettsia endosymbiont of Ixodes scapularis]